MTTEDSSINSLADKPWHGRMDESWTIEKNAFPEEGLENFEKNGLLGECSWMVLKMEMEEKCLKRGEASNLIRVDVFLSLVQTGCHFVVAPTNLQTFARRTHHSF